MRLLLDTCVWGGAKSRLEAAGHDVVWAGDWSSDPGDEEILAHAHAEQRILVTLDKDFGKLLIVRGLPHAGLIRLVHIPARSQAAVCLQALNAHGRELLVGGVITAEPGRLRIRPADPRG